MRKDKEYSVLMGKHGKSGVAFLPAAPLVRRVILRHVAHGIFGIAIFIVS